MQAEKRVQSGAIVREHMHKELLGAEERMRLLQQEIALIKVQVSFCCILVAAASMYKCIADLLPR
jgi:hypothetical protein